MNKEKIKFLHVKLSIVLAFWKDTLNFTIMIKAARMSQILPGWQDISQKFLLKLFKHVGHLPRTVSGSLNSRTKSNSCDLQGRIAHKHS